MEKVKVAIAGLGSIAQIVHLPMLVKMSNVEITALCDKDLSKAKNLSRKYNIKRSYKEIEDLLSDTPETQAIIISAQTDAHKNIAIKSLNAGKEIFIEKPMGRNSKEASEIAAAAHKAKKNVMVGMNNRFRHDAMLQRSFIRANEIGEVFYVKAGWLKSPSSGQKWFLEREHSGGGVVIDNGIAMLDMGLWMLGFPEIHSVSAVNYYHNTKSVEDSNFTFLRFKNGASLTIEVSWSIVKDEFFYCNVFGKNGSSTINPLRINKRMEGDLFDITPKNVKTTSAYKDSFQKELNHFIGVVQGRNKLISSADEAVKVMKIIETIYKSAKTGKEIIFK